MQQAGQITYLGIGPPTIGTRFVVHDTPQSVRGDKGPPADFFDAGPVVVGVVEVFVTTLWVTHSGASWQLCRWRPSRLPYFVPWDVFLSLLLDSIVWALARCSGPARPALGV